MFRIFRRHDPDLFQMSPAQLLRLVRHMVDRDANLVICPGDVATALNMPSMVDLWRAAPDLCRELGDRVHREYVSPWPPVFPEAPIRTWENTMSRTHAAVYRATWQFGVPVDDLMASGQLTATLAKMSETTPEILAPQRWQELASVLPTRLREIATAKAKTMGAADAAGAPLAMIEVLENSSIEEITKC